MRAPRPLLLAATLVLAAACAGCVDDRVLLERGPLGPADYSVRLSVRGDPAAATDAVTAALRVEDRPDGASLRLSVSGEPPVVAELRRLSTGKLELEAVEGVSPGSAGEADLASLVGQLDPPLSPRPVRLREPWSSDRRIATQSLDAVLRSRLRIVRFRRTAGVDAAELRGDVSGTLKTQSAAGVFSGTVRGRTTIAWALGLGRLASSETRLVWTIPGVGRLVVLTVVGPRG